MTHEPTRDGDEISRLIKALEEMRQALVEKLRKTDEVMRDLEAAQPKYEPER